MRHPLCPAQDRRHPRAQHPDQPAGQDTVAQPERQGCRLAEGGKMRGNRDQRHALTGRCAWHGDRQCLGQAQKQKGDAMRARPRRGKKIAQRDGLAFRQIFQCLCERPLDGHPCLSCLPEVIMDPMRQMVAHGEGMRAGDCPARCAGWPAPLG